VPRPHSWGRLLLFDRFRESRAIFLQHKQA
jgi:hypothetical protein